MWTHSGEEGFGSRDELSDTRMRAKPSVTVLTGNRRYTSYGNPCEGSFDCSANERKEWVYECRL